MTQRKEASRGISTKIINTMSTASKPTECWTIQEVADELGVENKQVANAIHRLWIEGKLQRHIQSGDGGLARYAMDIPAADRKNYVPRSESPPAKGYIPKKRRGNTITAKEVRMMFAEVQRKLMQLEDVVMARIENAEETEKNLTKLRNLL